MQEMNNKEFRQGEDIVALETFLLDSEQLDALEEMLNQFNAFETLGIIKTEIRHSNVLAWLLNPTETHGLGDLFLKNFIKNIFYENKHILGEGKGFIEISLMDFSSFEVLREWQNIDLLLKSDKEEFALAIENKVDSKEGEDPSDTENWIIMDYERVSRLIEKVLEAKGNSINPSARAFIDQYLTILRRYVVGDSEVKRLCQEIYKKHQKALNLIFDNKPDFCLKIREHLEKLIGGRQELELDQSSKTAIRFVTKQIDDLVPHKGEGWTNTKRILLFEFGNRPGNLTLRLIIGPGEDEIRQSLYDITGKDRKPFKHSQKTLTNKWLTIYTKEIVKYKDKEYFDEKEVLDKIDAEFKNFIEKDCKMIETILVENIPKYI